MKNRNREERCGLCYWRKGDPYLLVYALCRRFPAAVAKFPGDWCGEFKDKDLDYFPELLTEEAMKVPNIDKEMLKKCEK